MRHGRGWERVLVGDWQSHTGASARLSDADLHGFVAGLRRVEGAGGKQYLGVIAIRRGAEMRLIGHLLSRKAAGSVDLDIGVL